CIGPGPVPGRKAAGAAFYPGGAGHVPAGAHRQPHRRLEARHPRGIPGLHRVRVPAGLAVPAGGHRPHPRAVRGHVGGLRPRRPGLTARKGQAGYAAHISGLAPLRLCERSGKEKRPVTGPAGPAQAQRQFLLPLAALLSVVLAFLAPSSSAPLVYWLGCLCSLVTALVLRLLVWFLPLLLRFSIVWFAPFGIMIGFCRGGCPRWY